MARFKDRETAIALRQKGMSYSQIKKDLGVPKSTLSGWLKNYPLSQERIRELQHGEKTIERFRETMRKKKEKRLQEFFGEQKELIFPLSERELYLAGLFLYWGEGSKQQYSSLIISNTDPAIINFFSFWLTKALKIPEEKKRIQLQLYSDMDIEKEIEFWSKTLKIPKEQFAKPYIKESSSTRINHKGSFGHGTCGLRLSNTRLAERTIMSINAIAENYNKSRV